jgi:NIMA (never in mitosis gene a)-related kinase
MTTLNHAFDAVSIRELALKILRGTYPPISPQYSPDLQGLIAEMLTIEPSQRPSIKRILEKEFIKARIGNLLVSTLSRHELLDLKKLDQQDDTQ